MTKQKIKPEKSYRTHASEREYKSPQRKASQKKNKQQLKKQLQPKEVYIYVSPNSLFYNTEAVIDLLNSSINNTK